jgi:hypothetical protein
MTIVNGYCALDEVRQLLGYSNALETTSDLLIEKVIEAASRAIDGWCDRRFYTTSADETKYYSAKFYNVLFPEDDIISITTLATDDDGDGTHEVTWTTSDYMLIPFNRPPYTTIEVDPNGDYTFPATKQGVKIIGKFGYCAIADRPPEVTTFCMLLAIRLFKRMSEAPFGVIGFSETGQSTVIPSDDPDAKMLIGKFRRLI